MKTAVVLKITLSGLMFVKLLSRAATDTQDDDNFVSVKCTRNAQYIVFVI